MSRIDEITLAKHISQCEIQIERLLKFNLLSN